MTDPKAWKRLKGNLLARIGLAGTLIVLVTGLFGPSVAPYTVNLRVALDGALVPRQPPSFQHPFGTDWHGLDVFSKVLHGARISLMVGLGASMSSVLIGLFVGLIAGYRGGWIDAMFMRAVDVMLAFPELLLAILIATLFEPGLLTVFLALTAVSWASTARLIRSLVLGLKDREYVVAARSLGATDARILSVHILPNILPSLVVILSMRVGVMILAEASLNFLGVGAGHEIPSWGVMVYQGKDYMSEAPWCAIFPATAIAFTVFSFSLVGDGLRDAFDPRIDFPS